MQTVYHESISLNCLLEKKSWRVTVIRGVPVQVLGAGTAGRESEGRGWGCTTLDTDGPWGKELEELGMNCKVEFGKKAGRGVRNQSVAGWTSETNKKKKK